MAKKKIKWVPAYHTSFWPTRAPITSWFCVPEGSKRTAGGYFKITCGKRHTTKLGAERHCKKLNSEDVNG